MISRRAALALVGSMPLMGLTTAQTVLLLGSSSPPPSLDLDFLSGTLDPRITFTRAAGPATYFDVAGVLQTARTNSIRNSTFVGGVAGTPGTPPTNFGVNVVGLSSTLTFSTINGMSVMDIRMFGTTGATFGSVTFEIPSATAASNGQVWTLSSNIAVIAGSLANITFPRLVLAQYGAGSTFLSNMFGPDLSGSLTSSIQRFSATYTTNNASITTVFPNFQMIWASGAAIDITLRFSTPQLELGSTMSAYIPTTTVANGAPRFDFDPVTRAPRGLLIEEARTNGLRNGTMVGAAPGTPGTLPTNWSQSNLTPPLVSTVVGTGTEDGIAYIDLRCAGTLAGAGFYTLQLETVTGIAALPAQNWAYGANLRLTGGSFTNVSAKTLGWTCADSGSVNVAGGASTSGNLAVTSAALRTQRYIQAPAAVTLATTAFIRPNVSFTMTAGAVDFTIRIGLPQIELGGFATSAIPTSGAAATRAADVATMPVGAWFNAAASSLAADYIVDQATNASANHRDAAAISDGTFNNRLILRGQASSSAQIQIVAAVANVSTSSASLATTVASTKMRVAGAWNGTNMVGSANGGAALSAAKGLPAGLTTLALGNDFAGGAQNLNGWISRARYWPRALSAAELQSATK